LSPHGVDPSDFFKIRVRVGVRVGVRVRWSIYYALRVCPFIAGGSIRCSTITAALQIKDPIPLSIPK